MNKHGEIYWSQSKKRFSTRQLLMKTTRYLILILMVLFLSPVNNLYSQACCSAGTPILSSLELPNTAGGVWMFNLAVDYNRLNDVLDGSSRLDDNLRLRVSRSFLFEVNYGISDRISVSSLLSVNSQRRRILSAGVNNNETVKTLGLGDAVFLIKYALIVQNVFNQQSLAVGVGPKIPIGDFNLKQNGIQLPEDLQPGSGSWDAILWGYYYRGFRPFTRFNLFTTWSYRYTGTNKNDYRFGNELNLIAGTSYQLDLGLDFSLQFRYRELAEELFRGIERPNTGGKWLEMIPGINFNFTKNISSRVSLSIPLWRTVNGTQLTTSYRAVFSTFFSIGNKN